MSKKNEPQNAGAGKVTTHEPLVPVDWPHGHVRAEVIQPKDVAVDLTGPEVDECVRISIHGHVHYLHSTTARALEQMLKQCLDEWNGVARAHGMPEV